MNNLPTTEEFLENEKLSKSLVLIDDTLKFAIIPFAKLHIEVTNKECMQLTPTDTTSNCHTLTNKKNTRVIKR